MPGAKRSADCTPPAISEKPFLTPRRLSFLPVATSDDLRSWQGAEKPLADGVPAILYRRNGYVAWCDNRISFQ
jgi:hypothetical protein